MKNTGDLYIRRFLSICHIAVMVIIIDCQPEDHCITAKIPLCQLFILQQAFQSIQSIFYIKSGITANTAHGNLSVTRTDQYAVIRCYRPLPLFKPAGKKVVIGSKLLSGAAGKINVIALHKSRNHPRRKPGIQKPAAQSGNKRLYYDLQAKTSAPVIIQMAQKFILSVLLYCDVAFSVYIFHNTSPAFAIKVPDGIHKRAMPA